MWRGPQTFSSWSRQAYLYPMTSFNAELFLKFWKTLVSKKKDSAAEKVILILHILPYFTVCHIVGPDTFLNASNVSKRIQTTYNRVLDCCVYTDSNKLAMWHWTSHVPSRELSFFNLQRRGSIEGSLKISFSFTIWYSNSTPKWYIRRKQKH